MMAIVRHRYGGPEVLEFGQIDRPALGDNEVLIRVRAAGVNPVDWHRMTGVPYIARMGGGYRRPKQQTLGTDVAGVVEKVGEKVTRFRPGDAVFGMARGSFAEYAGVGEDRLTAKPGGVSFEQAAAVPVAALTAVQGLRKAGTEAGHSVLVNGASGGVGTFAVQIAKAMGAKVTAVCRTRNVEMVRSLGADRVIDYTSEDFVHSGRYDVLLDVAGTRTIAQRRRVLKPHGALVMVGGPKDNRWVGPLGSFLLISVAGKMGTRRMMGMLTESNVDDLAFVARLMETGEVTSVIERAWPLAQAAQALRYMGEGHARGKLVLVV